MAAAAALLRPSAGRVLRSASAIVCRPVTAASHVLRVDGYSHLSQLLSTGEHVESSAFDAGGHSWSLRLYPNGDTAESKSHIAVFLRLVSSPSGEGSGVSAGAEFSVLDRLGNPALAVKRTQMRIFEVGDTFWGIRRWISREELERSEHLMDDSFAVQCDVTVATLRTCRDHMAFISRNLGS